MSDSEAEEEALDSDGDTDGRGGNSGESDSVIETGWGRGPVALGDDGELCIGYALQMWESFSCLFFWPSCLFSQPWSTNVLESSNNALASQSQCETKRTDQGQAQS